MSQSKTFVNLLATIPKLDEMPGGASLQAKLVEWTIQMKRILRAADPTDTHGHIGAFLSTAEFARYQLPSVTPEIYQRLPQVPALAPDATGTAIAEYRAAVDEFTTERNQLLALQHAIHDALPTHIQDEFTTPEGNVHYGTTHEQWAKIRLCIGNVDQEQLDGEHSKLLAPYHLSSTLPSLFHTHDQGHRFRATVQFPYTEHEKLQLITAALTPAGIFHLTLRQFQREVELVDRRYADLKRLMLKEGQRDIDASKAIILNSAHLLETTAGHAKDTEILALKAQLKALTEKGREPQTERPSNHFCWTCGSQQNHPSFKCPAPATGHQKGATRRDKMGSRKM